VKVMARQVETITIRKVTYRVQRVTNPEVFLLPVKLVLHSPRGKSYLLIPDRRRSDRLIGIAPITHFSLPRMSPFIGMWFAISEHGTLMVAPADA